MFSWDDNNFNLEHVKEELADVINYSIQLSQILNLDLIDIVNSKMDKNEKKYPFEKAKGNAKKYIEFDDSHYIFLGAPVWWGELSYIIKDFVLSNDFTDKTIIPFATASSSNFSVSDLTYLSEEATWMEGRRFRQNEISEENVTNWIDSLNISFNN